MAYHPKPAALEPPPLSRRATEHQWLQLDGGRYKCVTCGAVCRVLPPDPEPADWCPDRYEPLTDGERAYSPNPNAGA
jgi:hypothetical protein